jgi:pimeloyl-ACP methyl ester carboxylesterase
MKHKHKIRVSEASVVVDGMKVHYQQAGSGPAMMLLHGLVGSAKNWDRNIEFLGKTHTVYALDLANMGESERVPGLDAGLEASADRVASFMDALGIPTADVAGHSHGGATAMMLAARHPGRVLRLVLFAPANPFCNLGRPLIKFYRTSVGTWFARRLPSLPRALKSIALDRMYGDPKRIQPDALDGYIGGVNGVTIDHMLGIVRNWTDDMAALQEALGGLAGMPTLLIWGDKDRAVGVSSGQVLAQMLGAELIVLPGVGHIPFQEKPEVCNRAVGNWLRQSAAV